MSVHELQSQHTGDESAVDSGITEVERLQQRIAILEQKLQGACVGPFWASNVGRHFHRPTCEWAQKISPWNFVQFAGHEEAVAAGFRPCKTCRS